MEAAGVAQAGHLNDSPVAVVRGISDLADGSKTSHADRDWQPRAAENAAAFATHLAEEITRTRESTAMQDNDRARGGVTITTHGSAQYGIVAGGNVTGSNVHQGSPGPQVSSMAALADELTALRDQLMQERSNGTIDEATYEAAHTELDLASKALEDDLPEGKSTFVVSLKRLRGLLDDVAELATKIATLIVTVNGLP